MVSELGVCGMPSVMCVNMLPACDCGDTQIAGGTPVMIDGRHLTTVVSTEQVKHLKIPLGFNSEFHSCCSLNPQNAQRHYFQPFWAVSLH